MWFFKDQLQNLTPKKQEIQENEHFHDKFKEFSLEKNYLSKHFHHFIWSCTFRNAYISLLQNENN